MIIETFSTSHPGLERLSQAAALIHEGLQALASRLSTVHLSERFMREVHRHNQIRLEALASRDWRVQAELRAMATRDL